jgi:ferredoxin
MSIGIGTGRCIGAAMRALHTPEVFIQDDEGVVQLLPGDGSRADDPSTWEEAQAISLDDRD